jgi:hypothetical protein
LTGLSFFSQAKNRARERVRVRNIFILLFVSP